jgi:tetratricopeptide (TPR) repeat protein
MDKSQLALFLNNLIKEKKFKSLLDFCKNKINNNENDNEALVLLYKSKSIAYANAGDETEYKKTLEKILKILPNDYYANINLGKVLFGKKNFLTSNSYFETSYKKDITNESSKLYSNNLIILKEYKKAEIVLLDAIKRFEKDHYFLFSLGSLFFKQNKFRESLKWLLKINKKFYSNELIASLIGNVYLKMGDYLKAEKINLQILKKNENSISAFISLIFIKTSIGDNVQAKFFLEKALKIDRYNSALIYYEMEILNSIDKEKVKYIIQNLNKYKTEEQISLNFTLSKYFDKQNEIENFVLYLNNANKLKRSIYKNYDLNLHLDHQEKLINYFNESHFLKLKDKLNDDKFQNCEFDVIFIVGMPRSGSTLVEQVLSSHSKIEGLGETNAFLDSLNEMFGNVAYEKLVEILSKNETKDILLQIRKIYFRNILTYKKSSCKIFVDKMLFNYQFISLIKICIPKAKFIFCLRDKSENCFSIYKHNFQDSYLPWSYSPHELNKIYDQHLKIHNHYKKFLSDKIYDLSYENLVANFKKEVAQIFDFINIKVEESCFNFYQNKRAVITASSRQVRKQIYTTSLNTSEKYKVYLPELFK